MSELNIGQLNIGDKAPDFSLESTSGKISLDSFKGKNIVIYFYPKDDTPGCTIEANEFTELEDHFAKRNTVVIGISKDDMKKHNKFVDKYNLKIILASDTETKTINDYGAWVEKSMYGKTYMGISRDTILIDHEGKIKNIWRKVKAKGHAKQVFDSI